MKSVYRGLVLVFIKIPVMGIITLVVILLVIAQAIIKGLRTLTLHIYSQLNQWVYPMGPTEAYKPWWFKAYYWPYIIWDTILVGIDYIINLIKILLISISSWLSKPPKNKKT